MNKIYAGAVLCGLLLCGMTEKAEAVPTTLLAAESNWSYTTLQTDLWAIWSAVNYGTFNWGTASWSTGQAGFGNSGNQASNPPVNTYWAASTDLALQKTINVNGQLNGDLTLNVASDNGFAVYVNGQQVAKENAEGYTSLWEYTLSVANSYFTQGNNTISVFAEDHGGATYFDMQLTGDVTPGAAVPEPATMLLFGSGLVGLSALARKRGKKA